MPGFWKHTGEIAARLAARPLLVTLDFDGTLAALAETPDKARLTPEYRTALKALVKLPGIKVFILSGRALPNLKKVVGIPGIYYGGNHGMELEGPVFRRLDAHVMRARARIAATVQEIAERFPPGTGVMVENKVFSASVHYRCVKSPFRTSFRRHMAALTCSAPAGLRWSRGHKVFELRPEKAPDKGDAVLMLARRLKIASVFAAGDDLTDEDMFRALAGLGVTLRVGCRHRTKADYCVRTQKEMLKVLRFLAKI